MGLKGISGATTTTTTGTVLAAKYGIKRFSPRLSGLLHIQVLAAKYGIKRP